MLVDPIGSAPWLIRTKCMRPGAVVRQPRMMPDWMPAIIREHDVVSAIRAFDLHEPQDSTSQQPRFTLWQSAEMRF